MSSTFSTNIAAAARAAKLAVLLGAAAAASAIGFAGPANADIPIHRPHTHAPDVSPPNASTPNVSMYGNPAAAAPYWRLQHSSDCGEMAAADVVGQVTGHEPTEQQITTVAETTPSATGPGPIWHPAGGTDIRNEPVLLAHYGVRATNVQINMRALEQDLAQGRRVIAGVNGETIWNQPGRHNTPDHVLVVTGIDSKAGVVHLNDSGIKSGCDERVPIATFEQAWATSGDSAVVTT